MRSLLMLSFALHCNKFRYDIHGDIVFGTYLFKYPSRFVIRPKWKIA